MSFFYWGEQSTGPRENQKKGHTNSSSLGNKGFFAPEIGAPARPSAAATHPGRKPQAQFDKTIVSANPADGRAAPPFRGKIKKFDPQVRKIFLRAIIIVQGGVNVNGRRVDVKS